MRPLPPGSQAPPTPTPRPAQPQGTSRTQMGGWASNSQGDLTDLRRRSEWGAGTGRPRGDTTPGLGPAEDTEGPDPSSDSPAHIRIPPPLPPNHQQQQQGPPPPPARPRRAPQCPSVPWRPAGGAEPPSHTQGPPILLWQYSLARGPRFPNLCALPPSCPYCEEVAPPLLLPLAWVGGS